ncbi:NADH-dependent flavin oxidoreductase [Jeotgalibaca sp. A122]|uniref:NADH-dependent flavin oxidoreductase n=1 Tax=Jeotgalibaca sp. A122 TaxID=3457322 RepID=UPI003FD21838
MRMFEPFTFPNGVTIENRIIMAPMTTNSSFVNGMLTTDELAYYKRRTKGLGAVITSCAQVMENGRFAGSLSAASDEMIPSLRKLADTIHHNGTKAILQIFHVGRMGSRETLKGLQTVSASAVAPLREKAEEPRALEEEEVEEVVNAFGEATRRAIEAGFDGVELHGANTYLIQQFFSPHSNRREDQWGGTLEKRMAFPLAVVEVAKKAITKHATKPFILGYRISPEELEEPGITLDDTMLLLDELGKTGLDYLHVSLGHYNQSSMRDKTDKTALLSKIITHIGDRIPVIGVGQVKSAEDINHVLKMGAPLVAVGRQLIVDPDSVEKIRKGKELLATISEENREDLVIPDMMWEYLHGRPGWLPFE